MSYCRFSSDNWKSDVYAYEAEGGGISIHVAGNRVRGWVPPMLWVPIPWIVLDGDKVPVWKRLRYKAALKLFYWSYRIQMAYVSRAGRKPIDLPYAGESLSCDTYEDAYQSLLALRLMGYKVPEKALNAVRFDMEHPS